MIKREFWEQVASIWIRQKEIELPDIDLDTEVSKEAVNMAEVEDWESLLEDLLS